MLLIVGAAPIGVLPLLALYLPCFCGLDDLSSFLLAHVLGSSECFGLSDIDRLSRSLGLLKV